MIISLIFINEGQESLLLKNRNLTRCSAMHKQKHRRMKILEDKQACEKVVRGGGEVAGPPNRLTRSSVPDPHPDPVSIYFWASRVRIWMR
jgi:hypothetical protein